MVRTLITPDNENILIHVPKDYIGKQVEIIAFILDEDSQLSKPIIEKPTYSVLKLDTIGYKFNREEANER